MRQETRDVPTSGLRFASLLTLLSAFAMLLFVHLGYLYIAEPKRFPIKKVEIVAEYRHVTHKELEKILAPYMNASYFSLPVRRMQNALNAIPWIDKAVVERVWPDTVQIILEEKVPVAFWGPSLMSASGELFEYNHQHRGYNLPVLKGPETQSLEVLQVYQKLGKILSVYSLHAKALQLRDNQSWVLTLSSGAQIYLGKQSIESRLLRFCKAWPAVFSERAADLVSVDMRYPRGMAVQWKQQTEK